MKNYSFILCLFLILKLIQANLENNEQKHDETKMILNNSEIIKNDTNIFDHMDLSSNPLRAGFEPFFYITNLIIDNLFKPKFESSEFMLIKNGSLLNYFKKQEAKLLENNWSENLILFNKLYPSLFGLILFSIAIGVFIPIIGLCICSFRTCCYGKFNPFDKKMDSLKRKIYAFVLFVLLLSTLLGTIILFFTNQNSYIALKKVPRLVNLTSTQLEDYSQNDIANFFDNLSPLFEDIETDADKLFDKTFERVLIFEASDPIKKLVETFNKDFSKSFKTIHDSYSGLIGLTQRMEWNITNNTFIQSQLDDLKILVKFIEEDLTQKFIFLKKIEPNSFKLDNLLTLFDDNLIKLKSNNKKIIQKFIDQMNQNSQNLKSEILVKFKSLNREINSINSQNLVKTSVIYYQFVYYALLGVCIFMLSLFIMNALGLGGMCTRRMHNNFKQSCHRGVAANFFLASSGIYFLLSIVLILICISLFTPGITLRHIGCKPAIDLEHNEFYDSLKQTDEVKELVGDVEFRKLFNDCNHLNKSSFINDKLRITLTDLIDANMPVIEKALSQAISKIELNSMIGSLQSFRDLIAKVLSQLEDVQTQKELEFVLKLNDTTTKIELFKKFLEPKFFDDLKTELKNLNDFVGLIKDPQTINHVRMLIKLMEQVLKELEAKNSIKISIEATIKHFTIPEIRNLGKLKAKKISDILPSCRLASDLYSQLVVTGCYEFLDNFNTFWLTLFVLIVLYLILTGFAINQADLFRKFYSYDDLLSDEMYDDKDSTTGQYEIFRTKSSNPSQSSIDAYEMKGYNKTNSGNIRYSENRSPPAHITRA